MYAIFKRHWATTVGPPKTHANWGRYHGGRRPSSDDSFHCPTVIPSSALDKPSIMKRYHCQRTTRLGVTARSPTMVTLQDTRFVECRWWNDGWTVKTAVTWRSSASMIPAPGVETGKYTVTFTATAHKKKPTTILFSQIVPHGCGLS